MNRSSFVRLTSLTALTLVALTLSQCKKSGGSSNGSGSDYYMKFNLNGNPVEYTSDAAANLTTLNSDGLYSAVLIAYQNFNLATKDEVTITLLSANAIAANVPYNDPKKADEPNGSQVPAATVFWEDSTGTGYLTAGVLADSNGNIPITGMVANAQVTITELTSTYLKGTFSGTVYNSGNFAISESITDGQFYLKREQ